MVLMAGEGYKFRTGKPVAGLEQGNQNSALVTSLYLVRRCGT